LTFNGIAIALQLVSSESLGRQTKSGDEPMDDYKTYESGAEWHYLNEKHANQQGGVNWSHRFGFNFSRLSAAEQRRYTYVYAQMNLARGVSLSRIKYSF